MKNEKIDLKKGQVPEEFMELGNTELHSTNGGSRENEKQSGWFEKFAKLLFGSYLGGSVGTGVAST